MRSFLLLRGARGASIAQVIHLLWTQGTSGVDGLNRAFLLGERRLNRRWWSLVDERARLFRWAGRGPLELGRNRLCPNGGRLSHLRWMLNRGLRDYRWPHRGALRTRPVGHNRRRGDWMRDGRWSDDLCRSLLREGSAVDRLHSHGRGLPW